jgi:hypothetical protein
MMITDPLTISLVHPSKTTIYLIEALFAAGVIMAGKLWMRWMIRKEGQAEHMRKEAE